MYLAKDVWTFVTGPRVAAITTPATQLAHLRLVPLNVCGRQRRESVSAEDRGESTPTQRVKSRQITTVFAFAIHAHRHLQERVPSGCKLATEVVRGL
jgi:hypothetical protein